MNDQPQVPRAGDMHATVTRLSNEVAELRAKVARLETAIGLANETALDAKRSARETLDEVASTQAALMAHLSNAEKARREEAERLEATRAEAAKAHAARFNAQGDAINKLVENHRALYAQVSRRGRATTVLWGLLVFCIPVFTVLLQSQFPATPAPAPPIDLTPRDGGIR